MNTTPAYAAQKKNSPVKPFSIQRRSVGPKDVQSKSIIAGCHTDLHFVNNDWGMSEYPVVPGHEIVGKVSEVGSQVTKFTEGDLGAIGCMVYSCGNCSSCENGYEQYCLQGFTATYNSPTEDPGGITYGGYSKAIVADESFILKSRTVLPSRGLHRCSVQGLPPILP